MLRPRHKGTSLHWLVCVTCWQSRSRRRSGQVPLSATEGDSCGCLGKRHTETSPHAAAALQSSFFRSSPPHPPHPLRGQWEAKNDSFVNQDNLGGGCVVDR